MSIGKSYVLALLLSLSLPAVAAEPVKIGVITTLSGPGGYLGQDALDAFKLAIVDGKLGGVPVQLLSEDAAMNPGNAKRIAERFLQAEKVKIVTGTIFTNVAEAIVPDVLEAGAFYVGPNSGPTEFSGKGCDKNYFTVGFQTAVPHRAAGLYANKLGYKNMFLLVPNYQAGKDAMEGFKQTYQGKIAGEIYIKIGQTDFSAELAQIRAAHPDALWMLLPGGLGINFLKQYGLAGLNQTIPIVIAEPAFDDRMMAATGDASLGLKIVTFWNGDFENAANKSFVENFKKTYGRTPDSLRRPRLRHGPGDRERAQSGQWRPFRAGRLSRRPRQGRLSLGPRPFRLRQQPPADRGLLHLHRGQGERRAEDQDIGSAGRELSRSLRRPLSYVAPPAWTLRWCN